MRYVFRLANDPFAFQEITYSLLLVISYSWSNSTKFLSFCMTAFRASFTKPKALLRQSRDCSCNVSRPILARLSLWLQEHTDLRAHNFTHSPDLWHQPRLANRSYAWSWRLRGINSAILSYETVKITAVWVVRPCGLIGRFGGTNGHILPCVGRQ